MIELPSIPAPNKSNRPEHCDGGCKGCGKAHIKLLGGHNAASRLLRYTQTPPSASTARNASDTARPATVATSPPVGVNATTAPSARTIRTLRTVGLTPSGYARGGAGR